MESFLVFAGQHTIRGVYTDIMAGYNSDAFTPITGKNTNFVALDYDASENYLYYSEVRRDIIWRAKLDGSGNWSFMKKN